MIDWLSQWTKSCYRDPQDIDESLPIECQLIISDDLKLKFEIEIWNLNIQLKFSVDIWNLILIFELDIWNLKLNFDIKIGIWNSKLNFELENRN